MSDKKFINIDRVEFLTGYKKGYLYNLSSTKRIPVWKLGRLLRFIEEEIIKWMENGGPKKDD